MMSSINKQKLNILLITHYYPEHRGGVEIIAGQLAEHLLKDYDDLNIFWMASDVDPFPKDIAGIQCIPMSASNFIENKIQLPYPLWNIKSLFKLWKAIDLIDIVHVHDYLYMSNIFAFIFAKIKQKPIVITQHIGFIPYDNIFFRQLLSFLNSTLGCYVLKNCDQVVFISEVVQKYFTTKTRFSRRELMICNGVDQQTYYPCNEQQVIANRDELSWPKDKRVFLFVGRFVEKKGLKILEQLARNFCEIHWAFAGWGAMDPESWHLSNIEVFRNRRGFELTKLYQSADLLVLPSKGEGFPLVIQESMSCGTPAMVGKETAQAYPSVQPYILTETVEGDKVFELWSRKIEQLLESPSTLIKLRAKVADFANEQWSWRKCTMQYHEIYKNLTSH
jgi:glycosyltransferase involved in cell wall biosynthesis